MTTASSRDARRRGISLIELLAAMTAASVVMATAAGLVHRSFTFESRSRQVLGDERTAVRLARQFREDVHAATDVRCRTAGAADPAIVVIEGPHGTVTYRATDAGLVRLVDHPAGGVSREDYRVSRPITWTADCQERLVSLRGVATGNSSRLPRFVAEVMAAMPPVAATMPGAAP